MDPYQILGVPRGCTREEVKRAFRATAWRAHPDRGGEDGSFIRLLSAYRQILDELDRNPRPSAPNPARAPRKARPPVPPGRRWNTGFGARSEAPGKNPSTRPPDPDWEPDLVIRDEGPPGPRAPIPPGPRVARIFYVSWLRQGPARADGGKPARRSDGISVSAMVIILAMIFLVLRGCWLVWPYGADKATREAAIEADRRPLGDGVGAPGEDPWTERFGLPDAETPRLLP
jgi:DnaJ domain